MPRSAQLANRRPFGSESSKNMIQVIPAVTYFFLPKSSGNTAQDV
jgi:hypothetical protein